MRIKTDQTTCMGAGQCVLTAPEVFDQRDDDGVIELLDDNPPEQQWPAVREAAQLCPSGAIAIQED